MPSPADEDSRWNELLEGLALLVGPDADADDPLLRSAAAHNIARRYMAMRLGLIDDVQYNRNRGQPYLEHSNTATVPSGPEAVVVAADVIHQTTDRRRTNNAATSACIRDEIIH